MVIQKPLFLRVAWAHADSRRSLASHRSGGIFGGVPG